jgi:hypothetical protein
MRLGPCAEARPRPPQMAMLDEAKAAGILDDDDNSGAVLLRALQHAPLWTDIGRAVAGDQRRSGRVRFAPLQYWKCERYIFERKPDGFGVIMPTLSRECWQSFCFVRRSSLT